MLYDCKVLLSFLFCDINIHKEYLSHAIIKKVQVVHGQNYKTLCEFPVQLMVHFRQSCKQ